jgi:hypothetical protein
VVILKWSAPVMPLNCRYQAPPQDGVVERDFNRLPCSLWKLTETQLKTLQKEQFESDPSTDPDLWRDRALFTLAQDDSLFRIDFIPRNPTRDQLFHVHRVKEERVYQNWEHHLAGVKFYLPVRDLPPKIFDLCKVSIPETLAELRSINHELVATALSCIKEDREMLGLSLTVAEGTIIWMKSAPPVIETEDETNEMSE